MTSLLSPVLARIRPLRHVIGPRLIHTNQPLHAAQDSPLYKLRQKTGLSYSLCKEALSNNNNDLNRAEEWLTAQALAHGLHMANKLRERTTSEGLVGLAMHRYSKHAAIVELNCETDFVAKNENFRELAIDLTAHASTMIENNNVEDKSFDVRELRFNSDQIKQLNERVVPLISKLKENIRISRAVHFKCSTEDTFIFGQVHNLSDRKQGDVFTTLTGRYAALVTLRDLSQDRDHARLRRIGNGLCQHVIGFDPTYLKLPEDVRRMLEEEEKLKEEKRLQQEQDLDPVVSDANRADEEGNDELPAGDVRDWPSLLDQTFINSESDTVEEFCKHNDVSVVHFKRFECGQSD